MIICIIKHTDELLAPLGYSDEEDPTAKIHWHGHLMPLDAIRETNLWSLNGSDFNSFHSLP